MKALIVANGDLPLAATLRRIAGSVDMILATDGAAAKTGCDLPITHICGDFDSIDRETARMRYPGSEIIELSNQERSDIEKTLLFAAENGAKEFIISGALGGRMDHSLVSLALLMQFHRTLRISLIDDSHELFFLSPGCRHNGKMQQECEEGSMVSLISFAADSLVSIAGVRWPLERADLVPGSRGVSNVATGGIVTIDVHRGVAAVSFPVATGESR